jgi:hypothetical protein
VGEILDGAFTALRRNPKATLGLSAIVMTFYGVVTTGAGLAFSHLVNGVPLPPQGQTLTSAQARQLAEHFAQVVLPAFAVALIVTFLVDTILTGMLTAVIGHSVLGRQVSITEAWRLTRPRLWPLIGASLLQLLVLLGTLGVGGGLAVVIGIVLIASHVQAVGVLIIVVGVIAALVFTVIFGVRLAVAASAVVLEGQGPAASLGRSWRLIKRSSWRVFGILLLTQLIVLIAAGVLQVPFAVINAITGHGSGGVFVGLGSSSTSSGPDVTAAIIAGVGSIVATSVTRPVLAGARVLLYVDLRMRREGLDMALQSATSQAGQAPEFGSVWTDQPGQTRPGQPQPGQPQPGQSGAPDQQRW